MATQTFEADGKVLGSREVPSFVYSELEGAKRPTPSYAYFCPRCGEIWGRLRTEGAAYTQCCYRPCEAHGDGRLAQHWVRGEEPSLLARDWPKAALMRELEIEAREVQGG